MRIATRDDLPRIVEIYNESIPLRIATADTRPLDVADRVAWFERHEPGSRPIYVEEVDGVVAGWLGFSDFVARPGYARTVQLSLYVTPSHQARGIGTKLLAGALDEAPGRGIRRIIGLVFAHNHVSLRLLERFGFEEWGRLPDVVEMDDNPYTVLLLGRKIEPREREDGAMPR